MQGGGFSDERKAVKRNDCQQCKRIVRKSFRVGQDADLGNGEHDVCAVPERATRSGAGKARHNAAGVEGTHKPRHKESEVRKALNDDKEKLSPATVIAYILSTLSLIISIIVLLFS